MNAKGLRLWGLGVALFGAFAVLFHYKIHFDWGIFWLQVRLVSAPRIFFAVCLIYLSVCLRAWRWATLLKPRRKTTGFNLIGPQFIGFTCVALFGSLGDLVRPYLLARKVNLPISSQIATYAIERMFDVGAAALLFSGALAFAPKSGNMLHRETFIHVGVSSFALTMAILLMAIVIRRFGESLERGVERGVGRFSPQLGPSIAARLHAFRDGLHTITSFADFLRVLGLSLVIWGLVALAYMQVVHAFYQTPELVRLNFSQTMLLLAASIGGSLVQLPVIGWFTQIAATAATMHAMLEVPTEAATACGALLLGVTFLFLIPGGLVFARLGRLSLRTVVRASELA